MNHSQSGLKSSFSWSSIVLESLPLLMLTFMITLKERETLLNDLCVISLDSTKKMQKAEIEKAYED